jgi:hypothetical protein
MFQRVKYLEIYFLPFCLCCWFIRFVIFDKLTELKLSLNITLGVLHIHR